MSQQKFASNVIEKCLAFGNPVERQLLIGEMLGTTDETEHLEVCVCYFILYKDLDDNFVNLFGYAKDFSAMESIL
jgi:hypothetical protein